MLNYSDQVVEVVLKRGWTFNEEELFPKTRTSSSYRNWTPALSVSVTSHLTLPVNFFIQRASLKLCQHISVHSVYVLDSELQFLPVVLEGLCKLCVRQTE